MDAATAVRKGATMLDERVPGWAERMNLDMLRLSNPSWCPLAQATGKMYSDGAKQLGLPVHDDGVMTRLGFFAVPDALVVNDWTTRLALVNEPEAWSGALAREMEQCWQSEIAKRCFEVVSRAVLKIKKTRVPDREPVSV